jgi:hypothetical protein
MTEQKKMDPDRYYYTSASASTPDTPVFVNVGNKVLRLEPLEFVPAPVVPHPLEKVADNQQEKEAEEWV